MEAVKSFIERIPTTQDDKKRCILYDQLKTEFANLGVNNLRLNKDSVVNLAAFLKRDAVSEDAHLKKSSITTLETILDLNMMDEDVETIFIRHLLAGQTDEAVQKLAFDVFKSRVLVMVQSGALNTGKVFGEGRDYSELVKRAIEEISKDLPKDTCIKFLVSKIIPFIFSKHTLPAQRDIVVDLGFHLLKYVNISNLTLPEQEAFFILMGDGYVKTVGELRDENNSNWHKLWTFLLRFCDTKLHSNVHLANKLLRVIEVAFRNSTSIEQRLKAYDCWQELIDNWSLNMTHMCTSKQIRLLVTPMKAKFSRMPIVILKRFEIFAYLLNKLQDRTTLCLREFLEFCFGPFEEKHDGEKMRQGKGVPEVCVKSTAALMEIIGSFYCFIHYLTNLYGTESTADTGAVWFVDLDRWWNNHRRPIVSYIFSGHNHNTDECLRSEMVKFGRPILNAENFDSFASVVINSVFECCILLNDWTNDTNQVNIIHCLWRSLLHLIEQSSTDTKKNCINQISTILRGMQNKIYQNQHYDLVLGSIIETIISRDDICASMSDTVFTASLDLLSHKSSDNCLYSVQDIQNYICTNLNSKQFSPKVERIIINYFSDDTQSENLDFLCELWSAYDLTKANGPFLTLMWPIRYLNRFRDFEAFKTKWTKIYEAGDLSDANKCALVAEMDKQFFDNPLLSSKIIQVVESLSGIESNGSKDFVNKFLRLVSSLLTLSILPDQDLDKLITITLSYINQKHPFHRNSDEIFTKVCTNIENIVNMHKNVTVLTKLGRLLNDLSLNNRTKLSSHLMPFLESLMLNEEGELVSAARKLIEMLQPTEKKSTNQAALAVSTPRSMRMINMLRKSPKISPTTVQKNSLRLFGKNLETSSPLTVKGSQLNSTPSRRSKKMMESLQIKKKIATNFDDDKSSDYVKIDTEVKLQLDKLSDHQKEMLKRKREDIPALYQDLSQSQSQDLFSNQNVPELAVNKSHDDDEALLEPAGDFFKVPEQVVGPDCAKDALLETNCDSLACNVDNSEKLNSVPDCNGGVGSNYKSDIVETTPNDQSCDLVDDSFASLSRDGGDIDANSDCDTVEPCGAGAKPNHVDTVADGRAPLKNGKEGETSGVTLEGASGSKPTRPRSSRLKDKLKKAEADESKSKTKLKREDNSDKKSDDSAEEAPSSKGITTDPDSDPDRPLSKLRNKRRTISGGDKKSEDVATHSAKAGDLLATDRKSVAGDVPKQNSADIIDKETNKTRKKGDNSDKKSESIEEAPSSKAITTDSGSDTDRSLSKLRNKKRTTGGGDKKSDDVAAHSAKADDLLAGDIPKQNSADIIVKDSPKTRKKGHNSDKKCDDSAEEAPNSKAITTDSGSDTDRPLSKLRNKRRTTSGGDKKSDDVATHSAKTDDLLSTDSKSVDGDIPKLNSAGEVTATNKTRKIGDNSDKKSNDSAEEAPNLKAITTDGDSDKYRPISKPRNKRLTNISGDLSKHNSSEITDNADKQTNKTRKKGIPDYFVTLRGKSRLKRKDEMPNSTDLSPPTKRRKKQLDNDGIQPSAPAATDDIKSKPKSSIEEVIMDVSKGLFVEENVHRKRYSAIPDGTGSSKLSPKSDKTASDDIAKETVSAETSVAHEDGDDNEANRTDMSIKEILTNVSKDLFSKKNAHRKRHSAISDGAGPSKLSPKTDKAPNDEIAKETIAEDSDCNRVNCTDLSIEEIITNVSKGIFLTKNRKRWADDAGPSKLSASTGKTANDDTAKETVSAEVHKDSNDNGTNRTDLPSSESGVKAPKELDSDNTKTNPSEHVRPKRKRSLSRLSLTIKAQQEDKKRLRFRPGKEKTTPPSSDNTKENSASNTSPTVVDDATVTDGRKSPALDDVANVSEGRNRRELTSDPEECAVTDNNNSPSSKLAANPQSDDTFNSDTSSHSLETITVMFVDTSPDSQTSNESATAADLKSDDDGTITPEMSPKKQRKKRTSPDANLMEQWKQQNSAGDPSLAGSDSTISPSKRVLRSLTFDSKSPSPVKTNDKASPEESMTDTATCDTDITCLTSTMQCEPPTKPQLTESEKDMALMSTVTVISGDNGDLPSSPITCDTPDRNTEFISDTVDISPINSAPVPENVDRKEIAMLPGARTSRLLQLVNATPILKSSRLFFASKYQERPSSPSTSRMRKLKRPKEEKLEVLTFSREIPSPLTAPGNSILKRKSSTGLDELSPHPKRKRVNFSDPAISEKRIFIKDCAELDDEADQQQWEPIVEERSGADEMKEDLNRLLVKSHAQGVSHQDLADVFLDSLDREVETSIIKKRTNSTDLGDLKQHVNQLADNLNVPRSSLADSSENLSAVSDIPYSLVDSADLDGLKQSVKQLAAQSHDNSDLHRNLTSSQEPVAVIKQFSDALSEEERRKFLEALLKFASTELPPSPELVCVHTDLTSQYAARTLML